MLPIIDSHCHLDFPAFDQDRDQILESCLSKGVTDVVVPGVVANNWQPLLSWCSLELKAESEPESKHNNTKRTLLKRHCALGLHPVFLDQHSEENLITLDHMLSNNSTNNNTNNKIVAVGEIGLDFFVKTLDKDLQIYFFEEQLKLANKHQLPVILHVRKSHDDTLALLKKHQITGGIAHAFNGSIQQAHKYVDLGFKLGFGGMLTFERSKKLRQLAKQLPLEAIVLETDSPDMTVEQHRGERNSPEYLPYVLEALANIRAEPIEEIANVTRKNTQSVLSLSLS